MATEQLVYSGRLIKTPECNPSIISLREVNISTKISVEKGINVCYSVRRKGKDAFVQGDEGLRKDVRMCDRIMIDVEVVKNRLSAVEKLELDANRELIHKKSMIR